MLDILAFIVRYLINPEAEQAKTDAISKKIELKSAAILGGSQSDDKTAELEKALLTQPDNLEIRAMLIGTYGSKPFDDNVAHKKRMKHVEWIITNRPEHFLAGEHCVDVNSWSHKDDYQRLKALWLRQADSKSDNPSVLINAADFLDFEDQVIAEKLLLDALALQPANRECRAKLASFYSYWDGHEEQALSQTEILCKGPKIFDIKMFSELPERAFAAGKYDRAVSAAKWILFLIGWSDIFKRHGGERNRAHTVLGKVALIRGDVSKARHHLKQSVINISCPTMCSFGPSLELAEELLEVGEFDAVLDFIDKREQLCGVFQKDAFLLRYQATERILIEKRQASDDGKIDRAFYDYAYTGILKAPPLEKKIYLRQQISSVKSQLKMARMKLERFDQQLSEIKAGEKETCADQVDWYQKHLTKLEALLADN